MRPRAALLALLIAACSAQHTAQETGVLMSIAAPEAMQSDIAALRVRVYSGRRESESTTWPERADETLDVEAWPAELFIRPSDPTRAWYARAWALDDQGTAIAFVEGGGEFRANTVLHWVGTLEPCDACDLDPEPPTSLDAGSPQDASVDRSVVLPQRDAGADAADNLPMRDSGTASDASHEGGAPRDSAADASPRDAAPDAPTPPDAGTPLPTGNACATTPGYPTPDVCSRCICARCASQVSTCYGSNDTAKNALCKRVRDCAQSNHCASNACYCGSSPTCLFPDGPCMQVMQTAAGVSDALGVQQAGDDPESPVGRSNQIGTCQMANCSTECGL